jgi:hypothetical protein
MEERDITTSEVIRVLKNGGVRGAVRAGKKSGECIVKMVDMIRGRREIGVVTAIIRNASLFIITVEWEDTV